MIKKILTLSLFLLFGISVFAQNEQYAAPVKWERYKVSDKDVSVLFPKIPVVSRSTDECSEIEYGTFYAYAEDAVYFLRTFSKAKSKPPKYCTIKTRFSEKNLVSRIQELKNNSENVEVSETVNGDRKVTEFKKESSVDWVFNDLKNDRWYELSVVHRKNAKTDLKVFYESIIFGNNLVGTEIGDGAMQVLGDLEQKAENADNAEMEHSAKSEASEDFPLTLAIKIRPGYTDAARQANVQGTVTLRVVFLANGGIGSVTPVSALGYGLTEKSIAAAKKIAFLPVKRNGENVSVTKSVQFSFSIY